MKGKAGFLRKSMKMINSKKTDQKKNAREKNENGDIMTIL